MIRRFHIDRTVSVRIRALCLTALIGAALFPASHASALSELRSIPGEAGRERDDEHAPRPNHNGGTGIPMPDPLVNKPATDDTVDDKPDEPDAEPVEVLSDVSKIPEPVARMRELIVEAAASGDIQRLRPLLGKGITETEVSSIDTDEDPVTTLKSLSGDPDGIEVLAILLDVLSTGFVHVDKGTPDEMYVWPYFTEKSLASLTPPEKVDLFRLITAGDFAEMEESGNYNFYRVGITPDGQWKFFVAGD